MCRCTGGRLHDRCQSQSSYRSAHVWPRLATEAGFGTGVFNVVNGESLTGAALVEHRRVAKISLRDLLQTGRRIRRWPPELSRLIWWSWAESLRRSSVPMRRTSNRRHKGWRYGIFPNAGQVCDGTSALLLTGAIYDQVMASWWKLQGRSVWRQGWTNSGVSPLVSEDHKAQVWALSKQHLGQAELRAIAAKRLTRCFVSYR
jgi:acyl-CoA reductase-like NAD-dependent aldehyde dehydrogenase